MIILIVWIFILTSTSSCGKQLPPDNTPPVISAKTYISQGVFPESYSARSTQTLEILRTITSWSRNLTPILMSNKALNIDKLALYVDRMYRYNFVSRHRYGYFYPDKDGIIARIAELNTELPNYFALYGNIVSNNVALSSNLQWYLQYSPERICGPYDKSEYNAIMNSTDAGEYALSLSFCESDIIRLANADLFGVFPSGFVKEDYTSRDVTILYDISRRLSLLITQEKEAREQFDYIQYLVPELTGDKELWYTNNLYVVSEMRPRYIQNYSAALREILVRYYIGDVELNEVTDIFAELELNYYSQISYLLLLRSQVTIEIDKRI